MITRIQRLLTTPCNKRFTPQVIFWFSLSLTFTVVYSLLALREAFSGEYIVQDDARQHIFWMMRFLDPELFPKDLIADYFQTVAPAGYTTVYRVIAALGVNPLLFNKLLPIVLNLVSASYCFWVCLELLPVPAAAFSATLLLSQALGMTDTVVSGTPKAFVYPLLLGFMYYLVRGSLWFCLGAIALQGLFYPQLVFISSGTLVLRLFEWRNGKLGLSQQRRWFCLAGLIVAFLVMLPYALKTNEFGPVISVAEARQLPEFFPGGRSRFFYDDDPAKFWLKGRSGIRLTSILTPATNAAGFLLLLLPLFPNKFPLVKQISKEITLLLQMVLASLGMFVAAHILLFKLHLPSRYTQHSLRVVMVLSAGIVFIILIDSVVKWASQPSQSSFSNSGFSSIFSIPNVLAIATTTIIAAALVLYPSFVDDFPITAYKVGDSPSLYNFFQQQPKDSLIASLSPEMNNIPTFAQRSVLVASEYAIPYHVGYYQKFRQRTLDLIDAQYSANLSVVKEFIKTYDIDFWVLNPIELKADAIKDRKWLKQYQPAANHAIQQLEQGIKPALEEVIASCSVFETKGLVVLEAKCILDRE
ncbi:hypothetical protein [Moorena sp. SIO3H5]|uniref:hypothetical protein n=1 Tax=Moorena sp. SIO3H5 TaxID=2607834 RepID=UPI0013B66FE3|nr:hypothetical protein [Moorena sp. SIO3H5]NEO70732.1 hypothetical protein [Moorena sp. SIO3H5]